MTKKTICFFNSNRAWGGGEKWHLSTAREFERRGYKSILVTNLHSELGKKALELKMNFYSFFIHNLSFINPFKILTMMVFLRSQKVDAIILNLPSDLKLAGIAARLAGVKKIIYRRGMPHPLRNTFLNRYLFNKVLTHVVVNSEEIGRSLTKGNESWFPKEKLLLVYNGVDSRGVLPEGKPLYEKSGDEVVIGSAGRLTEQKGQKYLIEMADILKNQGVKFKLLIAGEGELRAMLKKMISDYDLENEVTLMGHVDDMPAFFRSIDIFVFPSLWEGSANTLIETLHQGKPCIAFDVSSNPEIIQHGVNGFLAKPFDPQELSDYVLRFIQEPDLREKFSEAGSQIINDKFDSRKNLDRLESVL